MKKIILLAIFITASAGASFGALGSYNPEYEDGIFDRIKFNFFKKDKKFIEIVEPSTEEEREAEKNKHFDERMHYKNMLQNQVVY